MIINELFFFTIASLEVLGKYSNIPHESIKITYFEFIFITKGHSLVTDNLNEIKQTIGQIRFVAPEKINAIKKLTSDIEGYYCLFDQVFIDTYSGVSNLLSTFSFFDLDAYPIITLLDQQS